MPYVATTDSGALNIRTRENADTNEYFGLGVS